jgi:hypothetical protein
MRCERWFAASIALLSLDLASSSSCGDLRDKLAYMRRMAVDGEASLLSR